MCNLSCRMTSSSSICHIETLDVSDFDWLCLAEVQDRSLMFRCKHNFHRSSLHSTTFNSIRKHHFVIWFQKKLFFEKISQRVLAIPIAVIHRITNTKDNLWNTVKITTVIVHMRNCTAETKTLFLDIDVQNISYDSTQCHRRHRSILSTSDAEKRKWLWYVIGKSNWQLQRTWIIILRCPIPFDHDTMVSIKINWRFVCVMIDPIRCFMSWWFMSTHVGSKYSNGRMRKMDEWHMIGARKLSYTNQRDNVKCQRRLTLKSMPLEKNKSVSMPMCVHIICNMLMHKSSVTNRHIVVHFHISMPCVPTKR